VFVLIFAKFKTLNNIN